ncbi:MAG: SH3 domain-containing protein [Sideroxydans sp.]|nr:SH3 domain-containing protein [Sideroxydans sp.]
MKTKLINSISLCVLLCAPAAGAAESGTLTKNDELKAEPFRDAKTLKVLAAGDKISIVSKEGGWYKIKAGKSSGWMRMLSVRKGDAKKASAATGLLALSSGRAATGKVVATTGVRGLNEEELQAASFNAQELQLAESYSVSKADSKKFAAKGKLVARPFDYLPEPK